MTQVEGLHMQLILMFAALTSGQEDSVDYPTLNPNWSYCYEFTWFGPEYNNVTGYNGTCDDYVDDTRAGDNIPCIAPIVIANDGTPPDMNYLWANHRASVVCLRSESQVCVKYSYLYNGQITNQTHMCARVRSEKTQISTGCFTQKENGYTIEMCVCKSGYGLTGQPCNTAVGFRATGAVIMVGLLLNWLGKYN